MISISGYAHDKSITRANRIAGAKLVSRRAAGEARPFQHPSGWTAFAGRYQSPPCLSMFPAATVGQKMMVKGPARGLKLCYRLRVSVRRGRVAKNEAVPSMEADC